MLSEQRQVTKRATIVRLRAMQSDKASQRYAHAVNELARAKKTLVRDHNLYTSTAENFVQQREISLSLEPALYEMQLNGLLSLRAALNESQEELLHVEEGLSVAKAALNESIVNKHIAGKSLASAQVALGRYWLLHEAIEAGDAQLAQGGKGGI